MVTIDLTFEQGSLAWAILHVYREKFGERLGADRVWLLRQVEDAFEAAFDAAFEG